MSRGTGAGMRAGAPAAAPPAAPGRQRRLALVRDAAPARAPAWRRLARSALVIMTLGAVVLVALLTSVRIE